MSAKARFIKMLIASGAVENRKGKLVTVDKDKADKVKAKFAQIIERGKQKIANRKTAKEIKAKRTAKATAKAKPKPAAKKPTPKPTAKTVKKKKNQLTLF